MEITPFITTVHTKYGLKILDIEGSEDEDESEDKEESEDEDEEEDGFENMDDHEGKEGDQKEDIYEEEEQYQTSPMKRNPKGTFQKELLSTW